MAPTLQDLVEAVFGLSDELLPAVLPAIKAGGSADDVAKKAAPAARELLAKRLPELDPSAAVWLKGARRPEQSRRWVVAPYTSQLMGSTFTSIALEDGGKRLLGLWIDWEHHNVTIGDSEKGSVAVGDTNLQLKISPGPFGPDARAMVLESAPDMPVGSDRRLQALLSKSHRVEYNRYPENAGTMMLSLAKNQYALIAAGGFEYPDLAAAAAIVEAAGGVCCDLEKGQAGLLDGKSLLCGASTVLAQL